jgi:hypothetical protein
MTNIEIVITRMKNDPEFMDAVYKDAALALAEYHLPAEFIARLKALPRAQFEVLTFEDFQMFGIAPPDSRGDGV